MPQPAFIEPMLAKLVEKLPEGAQWEYELKLDGYGAIRWGKSQRQLFHREQLIIALCCCASIALLGHFLIFDEQIGCVQ